MGYVAIVKVYFNFFLTQNLSFSDPVELLKKKDPVKSRKFINLLLLPGI